MGETGTQPFHAPRETRPGAATVVAVLLLLTCSGITAAIAVPTLPFAPESSKKCFRAKPEVPFPPAAH
ncbi:hypothetical protein [Gordonia sp. FQ]|uniref:hypothetical protein n=1 Tax=Gordonia sp. FQ TaxID=3446634 RepID=UPI003F83A003